MAITLTQYKRHLNLQRHKIVSIDQEYNNEPEATCTVFDNFLADPRYTFAGFSIDGDKKRLVRVNLEEANFVDIQKEWRVPEATKELDSLGDVSGMLIDDYYNNMKKKITDDEHKHWATLPLSIRHIEYVAKDAYAAYEI
ncbi:uncharacterized protein [Aegilops tauschii subsp. strangulata]|uniref:uncharacterized protein n=1 Tax=Aegilops tauschii subsp. strangulata TaxID=200361 RepID=UPI003CC8E1DC